MGPFTLDYYPRVSKETKPDFEGWAFYCMKTQDYIKEWEVFWHPNNYRNRKADVKQFEMDKMYQTFRSPFPFKLPNGDIVT